MKDICLNKQVIQSYFTHFLCNCCKKVKFWPHHYGKVTLTRQFTSSTMHVVQTICTLQLKLLELIIITGVKLLPPNIFSQIKIILKHFTYYLITQSNLNFKFQIVLLSHLIISLGFHSKVRICKFLKSILLFFFVSKKLILFISMIK